MNRKGKVVLVAVCYVLLFALSGCYGGDDISEAHVSFRVSEEDEFYKYTELDTSKVIVDVNGESYKLSEVPETWELKLEDTMVMSDTIPISLLGKPYTCKLGDSFVDEEYIEWSYGGNSYIPVGLESGELDASLVSGTIVYSNGEEVPIKVESASLENSGDSFRVTVYDGVNTYHWDSWSDSYSEDIDDARAKPEYTEETD